MKLPKSARRRVVIGVLVCAAIAFLGWYVGSYAALSRQGMAEQQKYHAPYFFYVPIAEVGPDSPGLMRHYWLRELYAPINEIDRAWFGGRESCGGITWGLSGVPLEHPARTTEPGQVSDPDR